MAETGSPLGESIRQTLNAGILRGPRERGSFGNSGRWQPDIKNGETAKQKGRKPFRLSFQNRNNMLVMVLERDL